MLAWDAVTEFERLRAEGMDEAAAHRQAAGSLSVTNDALARYARRRGEGWDVEMARDHAAGEAAYVLARDLSEHGIEVPRRPEWDRPAPVARPDFDRDAPVNEIVREALDYVEDLVAVGVERDEAYHALRAAPVAQSVVDEYDGALMAGLTFEQAREQVIDSLHVPAEFAVDDVTSAPPPRNERTAHILRDLVFEQQMDQLGTSPGEFDQIIRDDLGRGESLAVTGLQEQAMTQDAQMDLTDAIRRVAEDLREEAPEREWSDVDAIGSTVEEVTMEDVEVAVDDDVLRAAYERVLGADRSELAAQLGIEPDELPTPIAERYDDSADARDPWSDGPAPLHDQVAECGLAVDEAEDAVQSAADTDEEVERSERCARWNAEDEAAELADDDGEGWELR
ncbi:hypothetical protein YIM_28905 [Amycolatopsis sp. YIM 10]|nr:hypothetical protein YIM_28905 [Amycolatopsis sp. YIM 10]